MDHTPRGKKGDKPQDQLDKILYNKRCPIHPKSNGFQQQQNAVNVIFGGDPSFSKRAQKLLLREILLVEPAI
jgi:hypothetical protein